MIDVFWGVQCCKILSYGLILNQKKRGKISGCDRGSKVWVFYSVRCICSVVLLTDTIFWFAQEALESCQTRIAKMELQQQQQSVSVEGLENASARALLGKLINLLLSVIAVLLVLVNALSGFLTPFIKSQVRENVLAQFLSPFFRAIFLTRLLDRSLDCLS